MANANMTADQNKTSELIKKYEAQIKTQQDKLVEANKLQLEHESIKRELEKVKNELKHNKQELSNHNISDQELSEQDISNHTMQAAARALHYDYKRRIENDKVSLDDEILIRPDTVTNAVIVRSKDPAITEQTIGSKSGSSVNHWTGEYKKTIDKWLESTNEMSYVYQMTYEKYRDRQRGMNTAIFVISSLTNLITISQFITGTPTIDLTIQIALVLINFTITLLTGIIKIYGWDKKVEEYTAYNQRLDDFFSSVMNETSLPPKMRKDAASFIMQYKDLYFEVVKTAPEIDQSDYDHGIEKLSDFLNKKKDNFLAKKRARLQEFV